VAAYAWGQDYHLVLPERLKALVDFVEEQTGQPVPNRVYTDTGPLLERELAQRAGLGWIGKNTCLIHPRLGSYFLLAEVMLGVDLEPDPPFTDDRCGTCTRCIQACPTGCILPDRTLDAERCISYLTIENRGSIPADLRPLMGRWVFGCDICQLVCPWNRFATADHDPAFAAEPGMSSPDLEEELGLSRQEFNRKFKRSPVIRTRWAGYLRNVAIAMGNAGSPQSIPALEAALQIDEPLIHEQLLWAIEQLRSKQ
jgi:epoxyqueuosine reductase